MFYFKPDQYDPVKEEIQSRDPFYKRMETRSFIALVLWILVWLVGQLVGFYIPFPFH